MRRFYSVGRTLARWKAAMSEISAAQCADADYTKMRLTRLALGPGGPAGEDVARFKTHCARFLRPQQK